MMSSASAALATASGMPSLLTARPSLAGMRVPASGPVVRLLGGPFKLAQELAADRLLATQIDRVLAGDRHRAGPELGHYLSACALMLAATAEPVFRQRAEQALRRLAVLWRDGAAELAGQVELVAGLDEVQRHVGGELVRRLLAEIGLASLAERGAERSMIASAKAALPISHFDAIEDELINTLLAAANTGESALADLREQAGYGEQVFVAAGDTLTVAQYIAAELRWRDKGLRLIQVTAFPERSAVRLIVRAERVTPLTFRFRHPAWCRAMTVRVNGRPEVASRTAGSWLELRRDWQHGDTVDLELPMHLHWAEKGAANLLKFGPMRLLPVDTDHLPRPMSLLELDAIRRLPSLEAGVRRIGSSLRFRWLAAEAGGEVDLLPSHLFRADHGEHGQLSHGRHSQRAAPGRGDDRHRGAAADGDCDGGAPLHRAS